MCCNLIRRQSKLITNVTDVLIHLKKAHYVKKHHRQLADLVCRFNYDKEIFLTFRFVFLQAVLYSSVVQEKCVCGDNNTRIYFKRVKMTTKKNNLQKSLHLHVFLFLISPAKLCSPILWKRLVHCDAHPLSWRKSSWQTAVHSQINYLFIPHAFLRYPHIPCSWLFIHICFNVWRQLDISFIQFSINRTSPDLGCFPSSDTNLWTSLWSNEQKDNIDMENHALHSHGHCWGVFSLQPFKNFLTSYDAASSYPFHLKSSENRLFFWGGFRQS